MYKEIIERYEKYKDPIIDRECFTIEEYYSDNGYTLLANYLSFLDFSELLFLLILVRFLCSWRIILFIYLGYILCQIYFSIYFVNINYKNTTLASLPLVDNIELILSSLLLPFGSLIRSKLKKEHLIVLNGGGGLFITNSNTSIINRTFTKQSDNLDLTNFAKKYMEHNRYPKISENLVYSYTDSFNVHKYENCISLFKECNINQQKFLMSLTNSCFSTKSTKIIRDKLFDDELILAMSRRFLAESNKIILNNAEEVFNVKFLIPNEKYDDLISLDSSQPLMSKSWTFNSIVKEYEKNHLKMEELLDISLTQGNQATAKVIGSVGEIGTRADYYVGEVDEHAYLKDIVPLNKGRYTYSDMFKIRALSRKNEISVLAVDITRKDSFSSTPENKVMDLLSEKILPFYAICMNVPQKSHELAVVLSSSTTKKDKDFIDYEIIKLIEEQNTLVSLPKPSLSVKSVIDTFLD